MIIILRLFQNEQNVIILKEEIDIIYKTKFNHFKNQQTIIALMKCGKVQKCK